VTTISTTMRSAVLGVLTLAFVLTSGGWAAEHGQSALLAGSTTDFTAIAKEIGGDRVQVYAPLPGYQEPELYIEEVFPSWIIQASRADGYIRIGLFADVWADALMIDARNPLIYPGAPGHVDASQGIHVLEVPTGPVDRSRGEIHLQGNPHYLLDPLNAKIVADSILRALVAISPDDADLFTANTEDFKRRIDEAMVRWQEMAAPLRGKKLAAYHRTWSYLLRRFGLDIVGYVEPKAGIAPSPLEIRNLVNAMVRQNVRLIIHAPVYHPRTPRAVARQVLAQIGEPVTVLKLPAHVGGVPEADSYFALFDYILTTLNEVLN
jgi:zinc/manganese transport system substrate-binding protein